VNTIVAEGRVISISLPRAKCISWSGWAWAPERCIHTHPIKREARDNSSTPSSSAAARLVADNPDEGAEVSRGTQRMPSCLLRVCRFRSPRGCMRTCPAKVRFCDPEDLLALSVLGGGPWGRASVCEVFRSTSRLASDDFRENTSRLCRLARNSWPPAAQGKAGGRSILFDNRWRGFPSTMRRPVQDISRFCAPLPRGTRKSFRKRVRVIAEARGASSSGPRRSEVASVMGRARRRGTLVGTTSTTDSNGSYSGQLFFRSRAPIRSRTMRDSDERLPSVLAGPTWRQHRR